MFYKYIESEILNFMFNTIMYIVRPGPGPRPRPNPGLFSPPDPGQTSRLQRPGGIRRGLPIFTREGATQEQW